MPEQDGLNPAERELEGALCSLVPAAARIDPVTAAFAAGRQSAQPALRLWQGTAAALVMICVGAWFVPARQPGFSSLQGQASAPGTAAISVATSGQSVLMMRQAVWEKGVDGLPTVKLPPAMSRQFGTSINYGDES